MRVESSKHRIVRWAVAALAMALTATTITTVAASAAPPPAQDTSTFCANVPPDFGGFTDTSTTIHRKTIQCLAYSGITKGRTATTFEPSTSVTRGEMASFIARTIDKANELEVIELQDLPATASDQFDDDDGTTHEASINRLAAAGVVSGRTATTFAPDLIVSRAQMATFINNAQEFLSDGVAFSTVDDYFVDDDTNIHEDNINGIASVGIAAGVDATHYRPAGAVLRANMATFIVRYLAVLHRIGAIDPLPAPPEPPAPPTARIGSITEQSAVVTIDDLVADATANVYLGPDGAAFSASTVKASSATDADTMANGFQVRLTGLTAATSYEYYVTQTGEGGESEPKFTTAGPDTGFTTATAAVPTVVAAAVNGGRPGTQLLLDFSEPVTALDGAAGKVTVVCTTVIVVIPSTTFSGTGTSISRVDADTLKVGLDGTVPADGSTCKAALGASAVADADGHPNAAQSNIAVP